MAIQDEHNKKLVEISIKATKMTLQSFLKITKFLAINANKIHNLKTKKTLKHLAKTENSISKIDLENLELTNKDFKIFKRVAKSCGLTYALNYDKHSNKYTFFFNSGKAEIYEQVYNKLRKEIEKREHKNSMSIIEKVKQKLKIVDKNKKEKKQKQTSKMSR